MGSTQYSKRVIMRNVMTQKRYRKSRPKTFKTIDAANAYAKAKGFEDFEIVKVNDREDKLKVISK